MTPVFPVLDEIQQFVQFGVITLLEQPAFSDELRRIVGKGFLQRGGVVAEIIPMFRNGAEHSGRIGIGGRDSGLDRRKRRKALPERQHVPGGGPVQGDTGRQPLKIINAGKRFSQLFPVFGMRDKPCNGILRFLNGRKLAPRVAQALLKQAATIGVCVESSHGAAYPRLYARRGGGTTPDCAP